MKRLLLFIVPVLFFAYQVNAQGIPTLGPPIWQGGGVQGFGNNVPEKCAELDKLRSDIAGDGLLGLVQNVGQVSRGALEGVMGDVMGLAVDMGIGVMTGGLGNVMGGLLGGLFGGGDEATVEAIEELTRVEMTGLVEAECQAILQDFALALLLQGQIQNIENQEYNQQEVRENIRNIEIARENIGYLREYIEDEYSLLYDVFTRHQEYEKDPTYWQAVKSQYAEYNIREADKLIINARENQRMTGHTHEYIDVLTGMLSQEDTSPAQLQQIQGYISAVHAMEITELKDIMAGTAGFIGHLESERKQNEIDLDWYNERHREFTNENSQGLYNEAQTTNSRRIVPTWAGDN